MKLFDAMTEIRNAAYVPGAGLDFAAHVLHSALVLAMDKLSDEQRAEVVRAVELISVPIAKERAV